MSKTPSGRQIQIGRLECEKRKQKKIKHNLNPRIDGWLLELF